MDEGDKYQSKICETLREEVGKIKEKRNRLMVENLNLKAEIEHLSKLDTFTVLGKLFSF